MADELIVGFKVSEPLILDLACGTGAGLSHLIPTLGGHGVGLDIAVVLLREARNRAVLAGIETRIHLIQADLREGIPICASSFDLVVASSVGDIFGSRVETAQTMSMLLRPGQKLLVLESILLPERSQAGFASTIRDRVQMPFERSGFTPVSSTERTHRVAQGGVRRVGISVGLLLDR